MGEERTPGNLALRPLDQKLYREKLMPLRHLAYQTGFILAATAPLSPSTAQNVVDNDRMSPEGRAVVKAFYSNPDPALRTCFGEIRNIESQLIQEGERPIFDWLKAKSLLKRQSETKISCTMLAEKKSIELLDKLPAIDRANYFRTQYRKILPPTIILTPFKAPSK